MAVDEAARLHLYEQARKQWGGDAADTLMAALPRDPDRFATKDDVAVLGADLRTEMADLRTEMADLRGELRAGLADLKSDMNARAAESVRTIVFSVIASNATMAGLVLAAVKLG